ncbi:MAG: ParB/RepB/Spo0J family partition protein [Oscillospiraceae bacterium]|nr:ParB/RepB/Spo0J family partition protein [Oscillospiraceae bacterium]
MAARKTGLGSGLSSLFAENLSDITIDSKDINVMRITLIEPKTTQPRKDFNRESLSELADSISKHGIIQPIVVRSLPSGYYQIIAGERRFRAAKMLGLDEVPVVIRNVDEIAAAEMTMVENLQREDLNPIEEAAGYKYLSDHYKLTQEEISKQVAKSRSVIANALRLLSLPDEVVKYIEEGNLSSGHARTLLSLDDPEEQLDLANKIIKNSLSVRETEKIVKAMKNKSISQENEPKTNSKKIEEIYLKNLQDKISGIFGKKVFINANPQKNGSQSGKLEIEYKNGEELESIIKILCGENDLFDD